MMIETILTVIIFCLGLAVGSFLNVVIIRGEKGETLGGRSHCTKCGVVLSWQELIPIGSFLAQYARCRHCMSRISWQYPLVELGCGLLYVLGFSLIRDSSYLWTYEKIFFLFAWIAGAPTLLVILVSDLRFQIIPNGATLVLVAIGAGAVLLRGFLWRDIIITFVMTGFLWALWFFSHGRWMGFGDVKLIFATSLILGFPAAIAAFLFAFWSGGLVGAALLLAGKKRLNQRIPFGPFILLGGGLAWFLSPEITCAYLCLR